MIVEVTQAHIDQGRQRSCFGCPVALAMRDAGFAAPVVTGPYTLSEDPFADWVERTLPQWVDELIGRFDRTGLMTPFSFSLRAPKWVRP